MRCGICDGPLDPFGRLRILSRHDVQYYQCGDCRFVRTEEPYWLGEAYSSAIAASDVGAVQRNLVYSRVVESVIRRWFDADGPFLDYGGGHGLFVRLMRDRGFDFRWLDLYAENIFARGFESAEGETGYRLVTALEVLEHTIDPMGELERMLALGRGVLFTTELLPRHNPVPGEWWYYTPSTGQHVSLFAEETLRAVARRLDVRLTTNGSNVHLLASRSVRPAVFRLLTNNTLAQLYTAAARRRASLVAPDFEAITG
jgi:hypothetical protein